MRKRPERHPVTSMYHGHHHGRSGTDTSGGKSVGGMDRTSGGKNIGGMDSSGGKHVRGTDTSGRKKNRWHGHQWRESRGKACHWTHLQPEMECT